jgi:L-ascorbate metabolism protein UlaG (beta-lactamase superfamily)
MSLTFRWLGVAGLELKVAGQVLLVDPFLTRPTLTRMVWPVNSDQSLIAEKLPECNFLLVTHSHYDHLMDVPEVLLHTGAVAYGSANTYRLLSILGVPREQLQEVHVGDQLSLGAFKVEVIVGHHSSLPFDWVFNGELKDGLHPPLRVQDYRMDICLGYLISVLGQSLLICAAEPHPADVLFAVAQEPRAYYLNLLKGVDPLTFIPIHWDNFTRPLNRPLRRFTRPGRLPLWQLARFARQVLPRVNVLIPEIFQEYTLGHDVLTPTKKSTMRRH